jgi:hypothetical protein
MGIDWADVAVGMSDAPAIPARKTSVGVEQWFVIVQPLGQRLLVEQVADAQP